MPNAWGRYEWWEFAPIAADPSRLPRLPTEVWERILDACDILDWYLYGDVYGDRARTFAACCSTCRTWLPRSRYHLYKHVIVQSKEHVKQVSKVLHSVPALRARVERLDVCGSKDGKRDASWIGLVGFHLGPKLKALKRIEIIRVDFSLMKLEAYTFWGAFNRAWRPDAKRKLYLWSCTVTHLNQLIRLAFATKAESLDVFSTSLDEQSKSATLPAPILSFGISPPLSKFKADLPTSDLMLSIPWHILAKQCPSLSNVGIICRDKNLNLSSPDCQLFLVSILCMLHRMQRHSGTNRVRLWTDSESLPTIEIRTRPCGESADADSALLGIQPHIRRELILSDSWRLQPSMTPFIGALTSLEDAMALANYTNRRFHHIEIHKALLPNSLQPLDTVLSRLLIATHDVHVIIKERYGQPREGCVVLWAKEHFPMLTAVVPNAFCDPEAGHPCDSHPKRASGIEQGQETASEEAEWWEMEEEAMVWEATEVEQGVGIEAGPASRKRKATELEGLEAEEAQTREKRRRTH